MTNLLKSLKNEEGQEVVNARDLWTALNSTIEYAKWVKRRIVENEYAIEGEDWCQLIDSQILATNGEKSIGRPSKDYALTIQFAKKLAMMEKSSNGERIRDYFLQCETILKGLAIPSYQIDDRIKRAEVWICEEKERKRLLLLTEQQAEKIEQDKPKVEFADDILCAECTILIGEFAKVLAQNGYNIGGTRLFKWMRENGYMGKSGQNYNIPLQKYVEQGLFQIKQTTWSKPNGTSYVAQTPVTTSKGQEYFLSKFRQEKK